MDRLYDQIVAGLEGLSDGNLFQDCVRRLLLAEFPTLVPVGTGADSGRDGVGLDGEGQPIILVATISDNVIGNVTRNLQAHQAAGFAACGVLVATSAEPSVRKRDNVQARVEKWGYRLVNFYNRKALADRLYDDPPIRKELLGLAGAPPCLSHLPYNPRYGQHFPLVGREDDLRWLRETDGDRLLVGQPGIGKSFLLSKLVEDKRGLFLRDAGPGDIADGIRELKPSAVIVEDAHARSQLLARLVGVRHDTGLRFAVIADCWPHRKQAVMAALDIAESRARTLERLSGKEIAKLIYEAGIGGPDALLHQLISQADGCPGRAAMLINLCLEKNVREALAGEALARWAREKFHNELGDEAFQLLGVVALGGDAGVNLDRAAGFLGVSRLTVTTLLATLGSGGIVEEVDADIARVVPPALRWQFVKDVFFEQTGHFSLAKALEIVTHLGKAVHTVIGAYACGARIGLDELLSLVEKADDLPAWKYFSSVNPETVPMVLSRHPEKVRDVLEELLTSAPALILPRAMEVAAEEPTDKTLAGDGPLRRIERWSNHDLDFPGRLQEDRLLLLNGALEWLTAGKAAEVGWKCLALAMATEVEGANQTPGDENSLTIRHGVITPEIAERLATEWPRVVDVLRRTALQVWGPLEDLLHGWLHPHCPGGVSAELQRTCETVARRMIADLAELAADRPGVMHKLAHMGRTVMPDLFERVDAEFQILFPEENIRETTDWAARHAKWRDDAKQLALGWAGSDAEAVVGRVQGHIAEAQFAGCNYPDVTRDATQSLASAVANPADWLRAMLRYELPHEHVEPMLGRVLKEWGAGFESVGRACLENASVAPAAIKVIVEDPASSASLVAAALKAMAAHGKKIRYLLNWERIGEDRASAILEHDDAEVACAAALGLWWERQRRGLTEALMVKWRRTVVRAAIGRSELQEMFAVDAVLAEMWVKGYLAQDNGDYVSHEVLDAAAAMLSTDQRVEMIRNAKLSPNLERAVAALVRQETVAYAEVLRRPELQVIHLCPLRTPVNAFWAELAAKALDAGYGADEIVVQPRLTGSWSGSTEEHFLKLSQEWAFLAEHQDSRLRKLAIIGRDHDLKCSQHWAEKDPRKKRR